MSQEWITAMIWGGAFVTLTGVFGLLQCGRLSMKAKSLADAEARALMEKVIRLNLASMGLAVLGLMLVVAGLFLR